MKRMIRGNRYKTRKVFSRTAKLTKSVNVKPVLMRGGIRL